MLEIKGLYKKKGYIFLKDISFMVEAGKSVAIECSNETSDLLVNMILGKEIPEKGSITLEEKQNFEYIKKGIRNIGLVYREESLYERMTVKQYIKSYKDIIMSKINYKDIMLKLAIMDIEDVAIKKLTQSQKKRVAFAREILKNPKLMIIQEPLINMDKDTIRIILENIEDLCYKGCAVFSTSISFKDIILAGKENYIIDDYGIKAANDSSELESVENEEKIVDEKEVPVYKIEKIPAKIEDRILLFDPIEIDYVESEQGVSNLNVRGEKFPCTLSLSELETRLSYVGFFRCHRSYLVNLQRIREVVTWTRNSYSLSLNDKTNSSIPLSKNKLNELKDIFKI